MVEVALGPEGVSVTLSGLKLVVIPGPVEMELNSCTVPLNPFIPKIVIVEVADVPGLISKLDGMA